ncbi:hypothetical protein GRS96_12445 [Rathayibacter sp. VKM Ac-2803]|uniref:hypothetical protein n=1 Tax=Rathayibacter sp. VKM Ac-2803 TaxID=2609256 RepID=UPI00135708CE|nr:hypothetical protein [Rathayibacter sp. VKM Ac-2803]MWV50079.1 hypothetical protein [Rathayibacter sp. VKM Ac-2803]
MLTPEEASTLRAQIVVLEHAHMAVRRAKTQPDRTSALDVLAHHEKELEQTIIKMETPAVVPNAFPRDTEISELKGETLEQIIDELRKCGLSDKGICDGGAAAAIDLIRSGRVRTADVAEVIGLTAIRFRADVPSAFNEDPAPAREQTLDEITGPLIPLEISPATIHVMSPTGERLLSWTPDGAFDMPGAPKDVAAAILRWYQAQGGRIAERWQTGRHGHSFDQDLAKAHQAASDALRTLKAVETAEDWFSYEEALEMLEFHGADADRIDADARRIAAAPPLGTVETAEEWKERVWAAWKTYRDQPGELGTHWQAFRAGFTKASPEPVAPTRETGDQS